MSLSTRCVRAGLVSLLALSACNDNQAVWTPYVTWFGPQLVTQHSTSLPVIGGRFAPGAVGFWNGRAMPTQFGSDTLLTMTLDAAATAIPGDYQVTVQNPDSFLSAPLSVSVEGDNPSALDSISPAAVAPGGGDFELTLTGSSLYAVTRVWWNEQFLQVTQQSDTRIVALVPAAMTALPGSGVVQLLNPWGQQSAKLVCTVGYHVGALQLKAQDLAANPASALVYASVPADAPQYAESVVAIDPATASVVASVPAPNPQSLAIAGDASFLYATTNYGSSLQRYLIPGLASSASWTSTPSSLGAISVAPGAPHTVATLSQILDDGVARAKGFAQQFPTDLQWDATGTQVFMTAGFGGYYPDLLLFSVDGTGATLQRRLPGALSRGSQAIHFDAVTHRIYGDHGEILDETGNSVGALFIDFFSQNQCVAAADGALSRAWFACSRVYDSGLSLTAFDLGTQSQLGSVRLTTGDENPQRLVRFGEDGLALYAWSGTQSHVYLLSGAFVK